MSDIGRGSVKSNMTVDPFVIALANTCDAAAKLFLEGSRPAAPDSTPTPQWEAERQVWMSAFGSANPAGWINQITSTYLAEAAHQVKAVGTLLRAHAVTASLDPLVRAVVERVGRVKWIVDPAIDSRVRAIRAGLEYAVSLQHYVDALDRLRVAATVRRQRSDLNGAVRGELTSWFSVMKPPDDPCDEGSTPTEDAARWSIEGETHPSLTVNAKIALAGGTISRGKAAGIYYGLAGFSHPSVFFGSEVRSVNADYSVTFTHPVGDLEKAVRFAAFGLLDAGRYWTAYYGAAPEAFQEESNRLGEALDAISVLPQ